MGALNLRDFPDNLRRKVKAQAALEGTTLRDLVIKALTEYLDKKGGK